MQVHQKFARRKEKGKSLAWLLPRRDAIGADNLRGNEDEEVARSAKFRAGLQDVVRSEECRVGGSIHPLPLQPCKLNRLLALPKRFGLNFIRCLLFDRSRQPSSSDRSILSAPRQEDLVALFFAHTLDFRARFLQGRSFD